MVPRSAGIACTGPWTDNSATAASSSGFLRLDRNTLAPACSSPRALITPTPRPPPGTTATFPSSRNMSVMAISLDAGRATEFSGTSTGSSTRSRSSRITTGCTDFGSDRLVADQTAQQCGAELGGDLLGAAPSAWPQPAVGAKRHTDVSERQDVRVAVIEFAAGDAPVDQSVHVLVDLGFLLPDRDDLLLGEPLGDVGLLLEVHRRAFGVGGD